MTDLTVTPPTPGGEEALLPGARPAVLIIDDEVTVVELLTEYLEGPDVEVLGSTDPRDGLRILEYEHPQVALVDLKMPDLDGLEFVRQGRLVSEDTVFLMMTGYASMESVVDALKGGIHDYLTKPFASRKSVQLIVRNALIHAQLQTNLRIQARMTEAVLDMGTYDLAPGESINLVARLVEAVRQVTDAPVVAHGILEGNRVRVRINPSLPLTDAAREQLVSRIRQTFDGTAPDGRQPFEFIVAPNDPAARGDVPSAPRLDSILSSGVYTLDGLLAVVLAAHQKPAAFTELSVRMTQALCNHATIMAQARQASLQGERRKIASILWNLTDGIVLVNETGLPEYMNPRATAVLGLSLGQRPDLAEFHESLAGLDERLLELVKKPGAFKEEPLVVRKQSPEGPQFFQVRTHALSIPNQPVSWMVVFGNVTAVKQESERTRQLNAQLGSLNEALTERNQDLVRVNKELDNFAYIASHDLQEPFRHIEIFVQFLENDLADQVNDETRYLLDQIRQNTGIASQLLKDLRTLSRVTRTRDAPALRVLPHRAERGGARRGPPRSGLRQDEDRGTPPQPDLQRDEVQQQGATHPADRRPPRRGRPRGLRERQRHRHSAPLPRVRVPALPPDPLQGHGQGHRPRAHHRPQDRRGARRTDVDRVRVGEGRHLPLLPARP